jgi:hypothetical protein
MNVRHHKEALPWPEALAMAKRFFGVWEETALIHIDPEKCNVKCPSDYRVRLAHAIFKMAVILNCNMDRKVSAPCYCQYQKKHAAMKEILISKSAAESQKAAHRDRKQWRLECRSADLPLPICLN